MHHQSRVAELEVVLEIGEGSENDQADEAGYGVCGCLWKRPSRLKWVVTSAKVRVDRCVVLPS